MTFYVNYFPYIHPRSLSLSFSFTSCMMVNIYLYFLLHIYTMSTKNMTKT